VGESVATLLWENVRMRLTLPKWGLGNPLELLKVQSSIARVKTPLIKELFISLES
jgi:ribosomal protein L29